MQTTLSLIRNYHKLGWIFLVLQKGGKYIEIRSQVLRDLIEEVIIGEASFELMYALEPNGLELSPS